MLPDRVSNPGPMTYESGALPIALAARPFVLVSSVINVAKYSEKHTKNITSQHKLRHVSIHTLCR